MKPNHHICMFFAAIGVVLGSSVYEGYAQNRNLPTPRDRIEQLLHRAVPSSWMKNFPLIIAGNPIAPAFRKSAAAEKDRFVVDSAISMSVNDTLRYSFAFDTQGRKTLALGTKLHSGRWIDTLRLETRYYAHGGSVNVNEVMAQGQWTTTSWDSAAFDAFGRWQLYEDEQFVNGFVTGANRQTNCLDSCGRPTSIVCESLNGDAWVGYATYTYTYSADGIHDTSYGNRTNGSSAPSRAIVTNDSRGNPITTLEQVLDDSEWTPYTIMHATYDELGNPASSIMQMFTDSGWTNLYRERWSFSPRGLFLGMESDDWSDSIWVPSIRDTCLYDENQRLTREEIESSRSFDLRHDRKCSTYLYDAEDRIVQVQNFEWINSAWQPDTTGWSGVTIVDSLGNWYSFSPCNNLQLSYRSLVTTSSIPETGKPARFSLSQNYPNPFNPTTKIQFTIVNRQLTIVKVFDLLGREVGTLVNEVKSPGTYTLEFDGSHLASGVYFYRMQAGNFVATKQFLLLK